jgi:hypothetical protein
MPRERPPVLPPINDDEQEVAEPTEQDDPFSNPFLQQAY